MRTSARFLILPIIALSLLAHQACVRAEAPTGTLKGILVDEEKSWPIRGANVYLLGASTEIRTQTDFKGVFSFTVPAGTYGGLAVLRAQGEEVFGIGCSMYPKEGFVGELIHQFTFQLAKFRDRAIVHESKLPGVKWMAVWFGNRESRRCTDMSKNHRAAADAGEV